MDIGLLLIGLLKLLYVVVVTDKNEMTIGPIELFERFNYQRLSFGGYSPGHERENNISGLNTQLRAGNAVGSGLPLKSIVDAAGRYLAGHSLINNRLL